MQTFWTIRETFGTLATPLVSGEVDLLFPWHGFSPAAMKAAHVALLKVFTRAAAGPTPETLVESYPRGTDLVATYAQTPERNVRPQVYWRYVEASAQVAGLELVLSMQTSLLDSAPATSLESTLPAGEVIPLSIDGSPLALAGDAWQTDSVAPRAVLFRPQHLGASYLEMVHPTDFAGVQIASAAELPTVRWHVFPERLEKGVIRRARVRGLFLPREHDLQHAREQIEAFVLSPLALST